MASGPPTSQPSIFVDSSVFFAAAFSESGPARALFMEASRGVCRLLITGLVVGETRRNLARHEPRALTFFEILTQLPCVAAVASPSTVAVRRAAEIVNEKDAPIVAAAILAKASSLVTHDKGLLTQTDQIAASFGLPVVGPGDLLPGLRSS